MGQEMLRLPTQTLAFGATGTTKTFTFSHRGKLHTAIMKVPTFTNSVTATLSITNSDDIEIYNSTAKNMSLTHVLNELSSKVPLVGDHTVTVTLSGVAGGDGGNVELSFYLE